MSKMTLDDVIAITEDDLNDERLKLLNDRIKHLEFELGKAMGERDRLKEANEMLEKSCKEIAYDLQYLDGFRYAIELVHRK